MYGLTELLTGQRRHWPDLVALRQTRWKGSSACRLFPGGGDPLTLHPSVTTLWEWLVCRGQCAKTQVSVTDTWGLVGKCHTYGWHLGQMRRPLRVLQIKTSPNNKIKVKVLFAMSLQLRAIHYRGPKVQQWPSGSACLCFVRNSNSFHVFHTHNPQKRIVGMKHMAAIFSGVALNTRPAPVIVSISTSGYEIVMLNLSRLFFQAWCQTLEGSGPYTRGWITFQPDACPPQITITSAFS